MAIRFLILALAVWATVLFSPVSGQINPPCTPTMITTFTPCVNFATNSSSNGTAPTKDCCNSIKSLMSNGRDCLCLITTGSVPFQIPINRSLAISLPRACNMPGVSLQCKAIGASVPSPAPGPVANGPSVSPNAAPPPSVTGVAPPEPLSPRSAPGADATPTQAPPAPATSGEAPGTSTGSRAGVTPSAAQTSHSISPLHLMAVLGFIALKYY